MLLAARALGLGSRDEAALVFCGSHKSLVSGVPIASALVSASAVGPMLLPLMVYYPVQLLVCAWIARRYAQVETRVPSRFEGRVIRNLSRVYARGWVAKRTDRALFASYPGWR